MRRKSRIRGAIAGSVVGDTVGFVACVVAGSYAIVPLFPCVVPFISIYGRSWVLSNLLAIVLVGYAMVGAFMGAVIRMRGRKPKPGHCQQCGYNLTGNESGTCPECGERVVRIKSSMDAGATQFGVLHHFRWRQS